MAPYRSAIVIVVPFLRLVIVASMRSDGQILLTSMVYRCSFRAFPFTIGKDQVRSSEERPQPRICVADFPPPR